MEPSGACWGLLRFFEDFCPKNRFWAVICIGIGTPPDKRPLAAIETLAREKPTQLMAQLRAVWPQVQQALDAGHTLRLIHPATDVMLTDTAKQAVQFSASWRAQQNQPAPGPDGRVLFAFGAGLPTVVCAPLRVCLIELQAGERLVGEPQIGDSVRWNVAPATYGKGDETTSVLVLKPQMLGLDTNLLITTDRRAYYVRLVSKTDDYVSRVAFQYNDDDGGKKWKEHFADQKRDVLASDRAQNQEHSGLLDAGGRARHSRAGGSAAINAAGTDDG